MQDKLKIYLVDDQNIANFITKKVIENTGIECEIVAFEEPKQALEALEEETPHYIFLDLNMPLIDGWEFLESMDDKLSSKVIILTSSVDPADIERAKNYPQVISYQTKPPKKKAIQDLFL
ncbi:response regulator [Mesonia aestuariivivens]|uniref:Response regulator n=1 Tax=Mesonia aestuariivivens TaxID=2796128 RepID=A0ABS6W495_9FLAO|nr:response regulator [Mesonia aestuariivivens]MBW2962675.1 response regulator [Mesonia aestuariivivens]